MTSKKEIKLLTELLNLEGVKVISHRQHQGIGIILQIESTDGRVDGGYYPSHLSLKSGRVTLATSSFRYS